MSRIWLNEQLLSAMGRRLAEQDIEISVEGRTASGRLVADVIARKKKFTLSYSFVTDVVLQQLRQLYETGGTQTLKIERANKSIDEYRVRFRPFSRARYLAGGEWFWENISIELEEI
jgi:hypothetical protein